MISVLDVLKNKYVNSIIDVINYIFESDYIINIMSKVNSAEEANRLFSDPKLLENCINHIHYIIEHDILGGNVGFNSKIGDAIRIQIVDTTWDNIKHDVVRGNIGYNERFLCDMIGSNIEIDHSGIYYASPFQSKVDEYGYMISNTLKGLGFLSADTSAPLSVDTMRMSKILYSLCGAYVIEVISTGIFNMELSYLCIANININIKRI